MAAATASDKRHMGRVAELCCMLCRFLGLADDSPALVHHLRTGQGKMRASHKCTVPLCYEHHVGASGVHSMGRDEFADMHGITEVGLLDMTLRMLGLPAYSTTEKN